MLIIFSLIYTTSAQGTSSERLYSQCFLRFVKLAGREKDLHTCCNIVR